MDERRLKEEQRLLKRIAISQFDLEEAESFANIILAKDIHTMDYNSEVHRALNLSLIVSYWRPFSENDKNNKNTRKALGTTFIRGYIANL